MPDHDVRIRSDLNHALARIHAEDLCGVRGRYRHELLKSDAALANALREHHGRIILEVVNPHALVDNRLRWIELCGLCEGSVILTDCINHPSPDAVPEHVLIPFIAQRWTADPEADIWFLILLGGRMKINWACFRIDRKSATPRVFNNLQRPAG